MLLEERIKEGNWWRQKESLLNLSDINLPPEYYRGNEWGWVQELTTYIFLQPEMWQEIYREYIVMARQIGNTEHVELKYYRDDEGYIRLAGTGEIYIRIIVSEMKTGDVKVIGDWLCGNEGKIRTEYKEYCLRRKECIRWVKNLESLLKEVFPDVESVELAYNLDEAYFEAREIFYDILNTTYVVL